MRTKTKKVIWYTAAGVVLLGLAAMLLPALLPPQFLFHELLTLKVHVIDQTSGSPIAKADVWVIWKRTDFTKVSSVPSATTDVDGTCQFQEAFTAKGVIGHSGEFDLSGRRLVVRVSGYKLWDRPLDSVFGPSRDYYKDSRVLSCEVTLERQPSN
jgi:hypothetical protein